MYSSARLRRAVLVAGGSSLLLLTAAGSALGHSQIVQPPSHDEPVVSGPISKAWAQAHCNSNAPATVSGASGGIVQFRPGAALPCPAIANPGGQVHP